MGITAIPDCDRDTILDDEDAFPEDPNEQFDSDRDGIGNNADPDDDNDGVKDVDDLFPLDATETADSDGDGLGDNADVFPQDASETADSDGDGLGDNADAFPNDASENTDTDADGIGDNADSDDDNDGLIDSKDTFPKDSSRPFYSELLEAKTSSNGVLVDSVYQSGSEFFMEIKNNSRYLIRLLAFAVTNSSGEVLAITESQYRLADGR